MTVNAPEQQKRKKSGRNGNAGTRVRNGKRLSRYIDERIPLDPRFIVIRTHKTREMNQIEHHSQRIGLEGGGFIEATRDDTSQKKEKGG